MQELCEVEGDDVIVNHVPREGEWITRCGSDIRTGAEVLSAGTRLRPQEAGLAASVGVAEVPVCRRLRVALFSTGSELVMPGESLPPGGIYNSNRFLLRGLLQSLGCSVTDFGIVHDDLEATRKVLREAAREHDLIVTSGGVSAGEEDHVKAAVQAEGELNRLEDRAQAGQAVRLRASSQCLCWGNVRWSAGKSRFSLRNLRHCGQALDSQAAGGGTTGAGRRATASGFRSCQARRPTRVPACADQCLRWAGVVSEPEFCCPHVDRMGGWTRRQSARQHDSA